MHRQTLIFLAALTLAIGISGPARADLGVAVEFSQDEIRIISAWYRQHDDQPRGKSGGKQKGLPPGIAKNLARGKSLPPGIAKQALPGNLVAELPAPPRGYERVVIDEKVLLVEIATQVIHDILSDAILR